MISQVVLFLIVITLVGIILLRSTISEKRVFVFVPAGMVWGVTIYIFLLNLSSKILPGRNGIIFATVCLISLGAIILISYLKYLKRFKFKFKFKLANLISLLIISSLILTTIYFARLKMTSIFPAADSNMQWAYSASFARGNYPIKAPWQPDLNPNYHLGAYFLEGAILSTFQLPLITIHAILNTYYLIAGTLFVLFLFWDSKYSFKNLWLIIATLVLYVSFGVIMITFSEQNFNFFSLTKFPSDIPVKGTGGAALVDLNSLSYLPARSLSLGLAFLAFYFSFIPFKNTTFKILSLSLVMSTTAFVEESMFLPMLMVAVGALVFVKQKVTLLKILALTMVVVILQGGFFSDFLSQGSSAFRINLPLLDSTFTSQLQALKSFATTSNSIHYFVPSPLLLAAIILIYAFLTKNKVLGLLGFYSLASLLCFLTLEYKYSPTNNIRFLSFASICAGTTIFYLLFMLLKSRSFLLNFLVFIILVPFSLIPTLLPELINQSKQINEARSKSTRAQILITSSLQSPFEQISDWANKYLPPNTRLIVIDTEHPSPKRSLQFQYKGLYTILGPQYIHTTRPEPGPEFFDLALTLNPSLFKQTKTEYVYIESESPVYQNLPKDRLNDLENKEYFQILQSIENKDSKGEEIFYRLYKVLPKYLDKNTGGKEIKDGTLTYLQSKIADGKTVYIADYGDPPQFSFWYRMAVILALKNKDIRRNLSQTDYQAIEIAIPYKSGSFNQEYDFYVLGPDEKPSSSSKLIWSNILASAWERI